MQKPAIDLDELANRLGGDVPCVAELVDIFLEDGRLQADEIRRQEHDLTGLRRVAHTVKGAAGNICAFAASEAAARLEAAVLRGDAAAAAEERLALLTEMDRLLAALEAASGPLSQGRLQ